MKTIVVALGGNAVLPANTKGTFKQQMKAIRKTAERLKPLLSKYKIIVTHGNGPQVGDILIQQQMAKKEVPPMPLDVSGAMSQGQLGYMLEQVIPNSVTVVTRVLVDPKDRAFRNPTKPIGPYYKTKKERNMVFVPKRGWRKVVPSPKPLKILELREIKELSKRHVVICCGGGGVPVIKKGKRFTGVEGVIDKDLASSLLANNLKADILLVLTDVPGVYVNYGKKKQKLMPKLKKDSAKFLLEIGEFGRGSMAPKILAALQFRKKTIITSPDLAIKAMKGKAGTVIQ
jgi:carbamate kinase